MVYRGFGADDARLETLLDPKNETLVLPATSSSSRHAEIGMDFAKRGASVGGKVPVVFRLRQKSGVAIEHLSHQHQEREVLLPKGAKFHIDGRSQAGGFLIVDGHEV